MKHIHLIGISGAGLSAIARVLLERGYSVSGSDLESSPFADSLASAGASVYLGHRSEHVNGAEIVVRSSAVPDDNVEVQAALSKGIKVVKRADFLGKLMAGKNGIAVAGTHGKTSTTAMISWMLFGLGLDPSFILGGVISQLKTNARAGRGAEFVIEADEYDRMFLGLKPSIAVVTNVEHDHPDCYPSEKDYLEAFQSFVGRLKPDGVLVACGDDPRAVDLSNFARNCGFRTVTYGYHDPNCEYLATQVKLNPGRSGYDFHISLNGRDLISVALAVPGIHSVLNACACLVVANLMDLDLSEAAGTLSNFRGIDRRFEIIGECKGVTVISDYAHHPTEIQATLSAAKSRFQNRHIWAVWQPHTYSRTKLLFDDFAGSFNDADHVLVTEVYAAREPVEADYSVRHVVEAMAHPHAIFIPELKDTAIYLEDNLQHGDILIVLSAGDADQVCSHVLQALGCVEKEVDYEKTEKEI